MRITLKAARINAGLSQEEVAKKLGVCRQTIIKWERDTGRLNFEKLQSLCRVYGVDVNDIFLGLSD